MKNNKYDGYYCYYGNRKTRVHIGTPPSMIHSGTYKYFIYLLTRTINNNNGDHKLPNLADLCWAELSGDEMNDQLSVRVHNILTLHSITDNTVSYCYY